VHIITLEDPVEFLFDRGGSGLVRQRQFGEDFTSFGEALRRVLRQDPDVVMVGEMRDLETIRTTLTLAETGHLVIATLHTPNAAQTIGRIIDVFPPHQQNQVRSQLSLSLKAVVAQRLVPAKTGKLVPLREVLVNTKAVANVIRENRVHELASILQMGGEDGMFSFDKEAKRLLESGVISEETYNQTLGVIRLMEDN
jgi:twitching motility protein PilT